MFKVSNLANAPVTLPEKIALPLDIAIVSAFTLAVESLIVNLSLSTPVSPAVIFHTWSTPLKLFNFKPLFSPVLISSILIVIMLAKLDPPFTTKLPSTWTTASPFTVKIGATGFAAVPKPPARIISLYIASLTLACKTKLPANWAKSPTNASVVNMCDVAVSSSAFWT